MKSVFRSCHTRVRVDRQLTELLSSSAFDFHLTNAPKFVMVKPLSFKGDKKVKKRKRDPDTDGDPSAPSSKALTTSTATLNQEDADSEDLTWVSAELPTDASGPVLLVLPTTPPSALATDANGKIFASLLENIDPSGNPASAEPHDVRQVWIANRLAGTTHCSFKGHHGKYLGCDSVGQLSATKEAISSEESWTVVPAPDMKAAFALQTQRERFVGVVQEDESRSVETGVKIRGDLEEIGFTATIRLRMQARFKPKLKVAKEERAREKISRKELEQVAGRRLEDDEVKLLKRARRDGTYHEALLDVKVKGKHDKFA